MVEILSSQLSNYQIIKIKKEEVDVASRAGEA